MLNLDAIFKGKKITQMGLGLLGRGIGDAAFLAQHGADLLVTDMKTEEQLADALQALKQYPHITYHLGGHYEEDFVDRDFILKGPSVPLNSVYINKARQHNIPVDMSASLLARITRMPIVGVTGTRGKSTVTLLVEALLKADGRSVVLGGTIKGVSNLALLETIQEDSFGVFELDSWQCQGFGEEHTLRVEGIQQGPISPQVAVFTTFMPDHLNYYKNDLDAYLSDKANIFLHQTPSDTLVIGTQALPALEKYKKKIQAHVIVADEKTVPAGWKLRLLGTHNRYNAGIAVAVARSLGIDDEVIKTGVENFSPIPGRLELLRTVKGIDIYNDTNATTPEATIVALTALTAEERKGGVILIAGGTDKSLDSRALIPAIQKHTKKCLLLAGTGTDKLLAENLSIDAEVVMSLGEAVHRAYQYAEEGDAIILSPAFSSFGMFTNEYDRGEQFIRLVAELE